MKTENKKHRKTLSNYLGHYPVQANHEQRKKAVGKREKERRKNRTKAAKTEKSLPGSWKLEHCYMRQMFDFIPYCLEAVCFPNTI